MATVSAIITAAGSGTRMGAPKQFLELTPGERIIDRVVATCRAVAGRIVVVVPEGQPWQGDPVDAVVAGGDDRLGSLAAGLAGLATLPTGPAIDPGRDSERSEIVVVHSASHPLASIDLVDRLVAAVEAGADGAVPVLDAVDVIKRRNPDGTLTTIGRQGLGTAQAPMAWSRPVLERALAALVEPEPGPGPDDGPVIVEESAAVEAIGGRVVAVDGELTNLHVTDRSSLEVIRRLA